LKESSKFKEKIQALYGNRLKTIRLYGSWARGDGGEDSWKRNTSINSHVNSILNFFSSFCNFLTMFIRFHWYAIVMSTLQSTSFQENRYSISQG